MLRYEGDGKNLKIGVRGKILIPFHFLYFLNKKILFIARLMERCYPEQNLKYSFSPLNTVKINLSQRTDKKSKLSRSYAVNKILKI